jgi:hypothetical protein
MPGFGVGEQCVAGSYASGSAGRSARRSAGFAATGATVDPSRNAPAGAAKARPAQATAQASRRRRWSVADIAADDRRRACLLETGACFGTIRGRAGGGYTPPLARL